MSENQTTLQVFVAYADQNLATAQAIYDQLKQIRGVTPWLAAEDVIPGQLTDREIEKAIKKADMIIVLLSKAVEQRNKINVQLRLALDAHEQQPEDALFFIPVIIEPCKMPSGLEDLLPLDYSQPIFFDKLSRSLKARAQKLNINLDATPATNPSTSTSNNNPSPDPPPNPEVILNKPVPVEPKPLTTEQHNQLIEVIFNINPFTNSNTAINFLIKLGLPRVAVMNWNLEGNPTALATELITRLEKYKSLPTAPYKPALGAFLEQLLFLQPGREDAMFLETLLVKNRLTVSQTGQVWDSLEAIQQPTDPWKGVDFLYKGVRSTLAICRVENSAGAPLGTGFLVKPNLVLTNYHVLEAGKGSSEAEKAQSLQFHFGYIKEAGHLKTGERVKAAQSGKVVLRTSAKIELDFALIELAIEMDTTRFTTLPLHRDLPKPGENLIVLQHPDGMDMQFMQGKLTEIDARVSTSPRLHHDANTLPGSSGSPVFDLEWRVIGLHSGGYKEQYNYAIPMPAILEQIGEYIQV